MKIHVTPCPFCGCKDMPAPPKNSRPFGKCPKSGKSSRAAITKQANGETHVRYVKAVGQHGGASFHIQGRIKVNPYQAKLKRCGKTVGKIVAEYLDALP